jgi:hypothetical protein
MYPKHSFSCWYRPVKASPNYFSFKTNSSSSISKQPDEHTHGQNGKINRCFLKFCLPSKMTTTENDGKRVQRKILQRQKRSFESARRCDDYGDMGKARAKKRVNGTDSSLWNFGPRRRRLRKRLRRVRGSLELSQCLDDFVEIFGGRVGAASILNIHLCLGPSFDYRKIR